MVARIQYQWILLATNTGRVQNYFFTQTPGVGGMLKNSSHRGLLYIQEILNQITGISLSKKKTKDLDE